MLAPYVYRGTLIKAIDGDTVDVVVDLGFNIATKIRFRLYGIDTAEMNSPDPAKRDLAIKARDLVKQFEGQDVLLKTYRPDKYGRWLADVISNGALINNMLLEQQLATPYFGGVRE